MTDNSASLAFFSQISRCGKVILEVEEKALDSSLRSLFNKRNHAEFIAILGQKIIDLQTIAAGMRQRGATVTHADGLHRLIQELIGLANALSAVCEGINSKTLGRPYPHTKYMADLGLVEAKKTSCNLAQARVFG